MPAGHMLQNMISNDNFFYYCTIYGLHASITLCSVLLCKKKKLHFDNFVIFGSGMSDSVKVSNVYVTSGTLKIISTI